jgi:hypothetical protein
MLRAASARNVRPVLLTTPAISVLAGVCRVEKARRDYSHVG